MKRFALILALLAIAGYGAAQQPGSTKPTVSVESNTPTMGSGAANAFKKHVQQLTQYLKAECGTGTTIRVDKADYLVKATYWEGYWVSKSVKIEIATPDGKTIATLDNVTQRLEFPHGGGSIYPRVCSIILDDWNSRTK
jgi:hypothetical protein